MEDNLVGALLLVAIGVLCILAAYFQWNWFFNSRRVRAFVRLFGVKGARIFYFVLGIVIGGVGINLAIPFLR